MESFLNLQDDLKEAITVTRSLKIKRVGSSDGNMWSPNIIKEAAKVAVERKRRAATWVKSALTSDLSPPNPLTRPPLHPSETPTTGRKLATRRKPAVPRQRKMDELELQKRSVTYNVAVENKIMEWIKGNGIVASTDLTEALLVDSKRWFLEYVDKFLDGITTRSKHTQTESQIAGVLCLVKKVDNWLTKQGCTSPENAEEMRAHGKLRKKIYSILLQHVESAAMALESIGSASCGDDGN